MKFTTLQMEILRVFGMAVYLRNQYAESAEKALEALDYLVKSGVDFGPVQKQE